VTPSTSCWDSRFILRLYQRRSSTDNTASNVHPIPIPTPIPIFPSADKTLPEGGASGSVGGEGVGVLELLELEAAPDVSDGIRNDVTGRNDVVPDTGSATAEVSLKDMSVCQVTGPPGSPRETTSSSFLESVKATSRDVSGHSQ
jgi:hypothetical protein